MSTGHAKQGAGFGHTKIQAAYEAPVISPVQPGCAVNASEVY